MMTPFASKARVIQVVFGVVFGLFVVGCETEHRFDSVGTEADSTDSVTTDSMDLVITNSADSATTNSTDSATTNSASTNTVIEVLNDDPNCELVLKYQNRDIDNEGQVHYVNRVLTSEPFGSANPVCVQYNDTRLGEVTVWKDQTSRGQRINILPRDRGIDKIVVWYE